METLSIVPVPNKKLHEVTNKVASFDNALKSKADSMAALLKAKSEYGIGLAANQVAYDEQIFVTEFIDPDGKETIPLRFYVNPEIVELSSEKETLEEGCLSVPDIFLPVERSVKIKVRAKDLDGKTFKVTAKGLLARLIQHETDHLNGILFTDRVRDKLFTDFPTLKNLSICFIGTGDFAEHILEGLILTGLNIEAVVTEKPKPSGRKKELIDSPVGKIAKLFDQRLIETEKISNLDVSNLNCDLIILADFGQIIPESILKLPKFGAINIHPSLLPKFRGPSPIQTAILRGEKETGVSIIRMTAGIDEGPVLAQETIEIWPSDNSVSLKGRLRNLALKMLLDLLPKIQNRNYKESNQDNSKATFTKKFQKIDGEIDWNKPAAEIDRQIRALYPWPGAYTFIDNKRLKINYSLIEDEKLVLEIVQPEGGKPVTWEEFLRGYKGQIPKWINKIDTKQ